MELFFAISVVCAVVAGFNGGMWMLWRSRAIETSRVLNRASKEVRNVKEVHDNLGDERKLQLTTLQEVFEYLNEHQGEFTSLHNDSLQDIRNAALHAIQNSTYRE